MKGGQIKMIEMTYCEMYNPEKRVCKQTGKIPDCCDGRGDYSTCRQVTSILRCAEIIAGIGIEKVVD